MEGGRTEQRVVLGTRKLSCWERSVGHTDIEVGFFWLERCVCTQMDLQFFWDFSVVGYSRLQAAFC